MGSNRMAEKAHLPGEAGLWVFIGGDILAFSLFFAVFVHDLGANVDIFHQAQAQLNQTFAAVNTILLLTSSWFVVTAVESARRANRQIVLTCLFCAISCGIGFCIIKFFEYHEKFTHGITLNTNGFWMVYFMYTFIHLAHVIIGLGLLVFLTKIARKGVFETKEISLMESGASYWHMVDLLWIGLFALLYLVK